MLSKNEIKIFKMLGLEDLLSQEPAVIYRVAVELAFRKNLQGPHIDALRRGYNAFVDCTIYRNTEAFENEIQFEDIKLEYYRGMYLSMYGTDKDSKE